MEFYLVCEGAKTSLDVRVLNLIIAQKMGKMIRVEAGGGSQSLLSVRSWFKDSRDAKAIVVRDRDYSTEAKVQESRTSNKEFYWSMHEIENFLIDPRILSTTFTNLKKTPKLKNIPTDENEIKNLLVTLAKPMLPSHIGLLFCQAVTSKLKRWNVDCPQRLVTKSDWLGHITSRLEETARQYHEQFSLPDFNPERLEREYDAIETKILAPEYLSSGQFLKEVAGKQLKAKLLEYIHENGVSLSNDDFDTYLLKALDSLYRPGFFGPGDDFVELAKNLP